MNLQLERKIHVNIWLAKARWLYIFGLLIVGILSNTVSQGSYEFPWVLMFSLFVIGCLINLFIYFIAKYIEKNKLYNWVSKLSHFQLIFELTILITILHIAGTLESMVFIFLVLPIVSSSILLGPRGSIITSIISSSLLWLLILFEHFGILPHYNRYGITTVFYTSFSIVIVNALDIAFFYIILGIFSGYVSKILISREDALEEKTHKLIKINKYRESELKQLDKTTKLLVTRDRELTQINQEYDAKIKELQRSQSSMLKAFTDLQAERKRAEEERNKTATIISNFVDPIIALDKEGKISLFNPAARSVFLMDEYDLGKKVSSKNNYSMDNFKNIIQNNFKLKKVKILMPENEEEITINYHNQDQVYKVTTAEVKDKNSQFLGTMKIFYNLTREKMVDKLKSEFISIAAHQLRTPLSAIKWVIKMILDGDVGKLNEEQQKLLYKGYYSNERIIKLVNDMLNVSRIEEGRFGYSFKKYNIVNILKDLISNFENPIKEKKINFIFNAPKNLPSVYIDKEKMLLVFENLIDNAIKYTPVNGKIEIILSKGNHYIKIRIKDNGVGIPQKDRDKIFTKFFRANNVVRMQTEGSGLGLFIVKNIIDKHKGEISINSEEGNGTEVVFTLPIKSSIID
jgi:signal transduction histidine kinase